MVKRLRGWKLEKEMEKPDEDLEKGPQSNLEEGRKNFNIVMKSHTFQHLVENSKFLNPKTHWTFSSEDFVGKISIVASSVSPGVSSTKISAKLAPKYRVLLHFLLTREGMDMAARNIDP
jgi:hypothetical protein